jgi:hypothetical protein
MTSNYIPNFFDLRPARLIPDMPFADYQALPAVNASLLKQPTRLEMWHYVTGLHSLPPAERALLEMTGANAADVVERLAEYAPRTTPRHFVRLLSAPSSGEKPSKAQIELIEACASEPVDAREFSAKTLGICCDKGWVTTEVREVAETGTTPQVRESRAQALAIGKATHTAILEPHLFDASEWQKHYQLCPTKSLTSSQALDVLAEDPSRELLTPEIIDTARRCRDAVWRHKEAARLLALPGQSELTAEVWDTEMQVMRKIRVDRLPDDPAAGIVDVKTTHSSLLLHPFRSTCYKFGYGQQLAFYKDTLELIEQKSREGGFIIAVTKEAPFMCRVFELFQALPDLSFIEKGREVYQERMAEFCLGHHEGSWTAYENEGAVLLTA